MYITLHTGIEFVEDMLSCLVVTKSLTGQTLQAARPVATQVQVLCAACHFVPPSDWPAHASPLPRNVCGDLCCARRGSFPQLLSQHFRSFEVGEGGVVTLGDVPSTRTTLEAFHSLVQAFGLLVRQQALVLRGPSVDAVGEGAGAGAGGGGGASAAASHRDDALDGVMKQIGVLELALLRCQQNDNIPPVRFVPVPEIEDALETVRVCCMTHA